MSAVQEALDQCYHELVNANGSEAERIKARIEDLRKMGEAE